MDIFLHTLFQTLLFILRQLPYLVIGLLLAEILVGMKMLEKLNWLTRPVMRYAHLDAACGIPFLIALVSPMTANSTLLGFHKNDRLSIKELYYAVLVNSFPNALMHWRWWLPAILSVMGYAGLLYFLLMLAGESVRLICFLTYSRVSLPSPADRKDIENVSERKPLNEIFKSGASGTVKTIGKMMKVFIPVTFIVFLLANLDFFDLLAGWLKGSARFFPVPVEGVSVIAAQFGNSLIAFALAGNLLNQNVLTAKDVILALFTGRIFASVMVALRMQLPAVVGIFGKKLGFKVVGVRLLTAAGVDLLMIFIVYFLM